MKMRLSQGQANALGVLDVLESYEFREDGDERPPSSETEVPVSGAVEDFVYGTQPNETMVEGDRLLLFLTEWSIPQAESGPPISVLSPTHSLGVLHAVGTEWAAGEPSGPKVDLNDILEAITDR